jgi:putative transcriptional regulator
MEQAAPMDRIRVSVLFPIRFVLRSRFSTILCPRMFDITYILYVISNICQGNSLTSQISSSYNQIIYWRYWMSISYQPLWISLAELGLKKGDLKEKAGIAGSTIAKMGNGEYVSLEVIDRICESLEITIDKVIKIIS